MGCHRTKRLPRYVPRWYPPCGQPRHAPFKRCDRLVFQSWRQRADNPLRHPKRRHFAPLLCRASQWPLPQPPLCQSTHAPWRQLSSPCIFPRWCPRVISSLCQSSQHLEHGLGSLLSLRVTRPEAPSGNSHKIFGCVMHWRHCCCHCFV